MLRVFGAWVVGGDDHRIGEPGGEHRETIASASVAATNVLVKAGDNNTGAHTWTLGYQYALSKRTALFARVVQIRDDEGKAADAGVGAPIQGGPDVIATAFGFRETPVFAGAGINPGGTARYVGAGIRHSF